MKHKFLQDRDGDFSNSRLIADIIIICSLIMVFAFIGIGVKYPNIDLMGIATAIGVLFASVAGSSLLFLYAQKKSENKQAVENEPAKPIIN